MIPDEVPCYSCGVTPLLRRSGAILLLLAIPAVSLVQNVKIPAIRPIAALRSCHRLLPLRISDSTVSMRLAPMSFEGSAMTIAEYPHPVLRCPGAEVVSFDENLSKICEELMAIMYQAEGVGLAAPQVFLSLRVFVYNYSGDPTRVDLEHVVCNPEILEYSHDNDVEEEGCLSSRYECCSGRVCRSKELLVRYRDVQGLLITRKLRGFEARVFQHEYDHVEGVLHLDRFAPEDRKAVQPELDVMVDDYGGDDCILDITEEVRTALIPPVLRARNMPPLVSFVKNIFSK